ncbi:MAG TPA: DUF3048 domain-containing protein, partial [Acidimicrobiia bacterium]
MHSLRHTLAALTAFSLIAAACSGGGDADTTTTTAATTTAATTTTTPPTTTTSSTTTLPDSTTVTTFPPDFASPLNGLAAEDDILVDRRAIAIKIDNHPVARPQSGLQAADAIIELLVEGGFTRFIALFHDNDTDYIGPVRSLRATDSTLVTAIGAPLVISGGQT